MEERKMKVLSIGAHPDDADTSAGGLLVKLRDKGWEVRLLSVTDGSAGTYDKAKGGQPLALQRRSEAAASGRRLGGRYDVLSHPDGRLEVKLEIREELIRYIRRFAPDLILVNRLNDYHADHRNTAQLVQDASFLLTVPCICPDVPYMDHMPVVLYYHDSFTKPYPFQPDVVVPMNDYQLEELVQLASCHESQYFDWMYWPDHTERIQWPREQQVAHLRDRYDQMFASQRQQYDAVVREKFGAEADSIRHIEVFEISEYGEEMTPEFLAMLEH